MEFSARQFGLRTLLATADRWLPLKLAGMCAAMFAFGFAMSPLYDAFCRLTGVGGKTANAATVTAAAPVIDENRSVRVEFLASVARGSPWEFEPAVGHIDVHPGQMYQAHFHARNLTGEALLGQAVPSVAPGLAAKHFHKTECFCFTTQAFAPHEDRDLLVAFSVAPELPAHIDTLSLSYTFFAVNP